MDAIPDAAEVMALKVIKKRKEWWNWPRQQPFSVLLQFLTTKSPFTCTMCMMGPRNLSYLPNGTKKLKFYQLQDYKGLKNLNQNIIPSQCYQGLNPEPLAWWVSVTPSITRFEVLQGIAQKTWFNSMTKFHFGGATGWVWAFPAWQGRGWQSESICSQLVQNIFSSDISFVIILLLLLKPFTSIVS